MSVGAPCRTSHPCWVAGSLLPCGIPLVHLCLSTTQSSHASLLRRIGWFIHGCLEHSPKNIAEPVFDDRVLRGTRPREGDNWSGCLLLSRDRRRPTCFEHY